MSILLLTFLILLAGIVTYRLFDRLVKPVRLFVVWLLMVSLAAFILQSREIFQLIRPFSGFAFSTFFDSPADGVSNSTGNPTSLAAVKAQSISQQDQTFLDETLQNQNADDEKQGKRAGTQVQTADRTGIVGSGDGSVLKGELVINSPASKRSELIGHKETVKRAQLVNHNEMLKRVHQGRSKQP